MNRFLTTIAATALCLGASFAAHAQEVSAVVSAEQIAILSSQRGGLITALPVTLGQRVQQGDLLAQFDCTVETAELAAAKAELEIAQIDAKTQQALVARGAGGRALVQQAQARERLQSARRAGVEARIAQCALFAPFDGAVSEVAARANETVQSGAPLLELVGIDTLQLEIIVQANLIARLAPGTVLEFQDAATQAFYDAEITKVAPKIDAVSQTIRIIARFRGETSTLLPGSAGIVRFK